MNVESFECFASAGKQFEEANAVAGDLSRFGCETFAEIVNAVADVVVSYAVTAQGFDDDLHVGHA